MHEQATIMRIQLEEQKKAEPEKAKVIDEVNNVEPAELITKGEKLCHAAHTGHRLTLSMLLTTDDELKCFTGINFQLLNNLEKTVIDVEGIRSFELSVKDRIILCLFKLKLNLTFKCLAVLFRITRQTCSKLFTITLHTLAHVLEDAIYWPSKDEVVSSMPKCFKNYKNTYVVLDCTEVPIEKPKCLNCKLKLYSHYKGCETVKVMIGCSPSGLIIHRGEAFGGRASDKAIFNHSRILEKLMPTRDAIMVDRGFSVELECTEARIQLIMRPKLMQRIQFTVEEVELTKKK